MPREVVLTTGVDYSGQEPDQYILYYELSFCSCAKSGLMELGGVFEEYAQAYLSPYTVILRDCLTNAPEARRSIKQLFVASCACYALLLPKQ